MPPHKLQRTRGVRYNPVTEAFEIWCPDCDTFWPATLEFWAKAHMQRCRACEAAKKRRVEHYRRLILGPAVISARNRAYYVENHDSIRFKDNIRSTTRRLARRA